MKRGLAAFTAALAILLALLWWRRDTTTDVELAPDAASPAAADAMADPVTAEPAVPGPPPVQELVVESGIAIHLQRRLPLRKPDPPYGPAYAALAAAAGEGDHPAQYRLGLLLYECRDVPEDAAELARQVDRMYQTRKHNGWDVPQPADEEKTLQRRHAECAGVPQDQRLRYRDWLQQAADAGLLEAQLDLMFHLPQGEYCQFIEDCTPAQRTQLEALQQEALDYVGRAREAGSAQALWTYGAWYMNDEVLPPDPVEAYAHFRALDQVFAAAGEQRRFGAMLDSLKARLRPVELDRAEGRARELLSNPACCILTH